MGDGPEQTYAEMTSGQPAAIDAAIDSCATTIRHLADAVDLIGLATDTPQWDSSEAYEAYNLRAWATRAAAEVTLVRVNRTSLALSMAAGAYVSMVDSATEVIEFWRRAKRSDVSGDVVSLARTLAQMSLGVVRSTFEANLREAIDFVQTDPLSGDQETWQTTGLIKSMLHDLNSPTDVGPSIPNTFATGDDDGGWTPQGLGFDPDGDPPTLLQTSYSGPDAQLSLVDPETGEQLGFVNLAGDGGGPAPDHAGGVTVHDGTVYVMSSGDPASMYSYPLDQIRGATPGQTVQPLAAPVEMEAGAYSTIDGNTLYVGTYEEDGPGTLYTYEWNSSAGAWDLMPGSHDTPPKTQGAAVIDGQIVFSTSGGRGNTSDLYAYTVDDVLAGHGNDADHLLGQVSLPTMSEGVIALDGTGLITTYESGASPYSTPSSSASLEDLWAAQAMTITPFSALDLTGGIDVVPVSLDRASIDFDAGARRLQSAAASIDEVSLPAGTLGTSSTGDTFASVVTAHCDQTSQWIAEGRISATVTADGLVTSAASYVATDQAIRDGIDALTSWMTGP
ncbi:hypothetical protein [Aeromicrobium stalagmiti]|uniref:hypothetical protein n=1 Tax=Aeromicrobium stalagmiti TaxID=2738988 RepID=UPI001567CB0E|nr:hypothetical protein [Aeromicrobium stalagmiti]NRQ51514.1 hypothetical protein [Aeromicrobium stalagmiti]